MTQTIDIDATVAQVVATVYRRFGSFVDRDDLKSECYLWMYSHPTALDRYLDDTDAKRSGYRLRRDMSIACERYSRKQKSQALGYDPDDEFFYSSVLVAALLPAVVLDEWTPPSFDSDGSVSRTDPAEGGSWQASRADVSGAWERAALRADERSVMIDYYVSGFTEQEIADAVGVDQSTISKRLRKGMRRVIAELGGTKPRGCPYDCECHDTPCRTRPGVKSNYSGNNQFLE